VFRLPFPSRKQFPVPGQHKAGRIHAVLKQTAENDVPTASSGIKLRSSSSAFDCLLCVPKIQPFSMLPDSVEHCPLHSRTSQQWIHDRSLRLKVTGPTKIVMWDRSGLCFETDYTLRILTGPRTEQPKNRSGNGKAYISFPLWPNGFRGPPSLLFYGYQRIFCQQ
jgi:hypothetical protein